MTYVSFEFLNFKDSLHIFEHNLCYETVDDIFGRLGANVRCTYYFNARSED